MLAALGVEDLREVAARCARFRSDRGRPATLWTESRLADVLADAVLDAGWPPGQALAALLAVAADPATRSPARLSCPGPWWEITVPQGVARDAGTDAEVAALEALLAETGGLRVVLQRRARAGLAADGIAVTRASVARRAVALLQSRDGQEEGAASRPSRDAGAVATTALLAAGPAPTAILAFNDRCATGVLDTLYRADVKVPAQVSVVGFDDTHLAGFSHIDLTTVRQDAPLMARLAVERAVARLDGAEFETATRDSVVPPALVGRGTTAKPPRERTGGVVAAPA